MSINAQLYTRAHNSKVNVTAAVALALTSIIPFQRARSAPVDLLAGTVAEIHAQHTNSQHASLTLDGAKFQNALKISDTACDKATTDTQLQIFCARSAKTIALRYERNTSDDDAISKYKVAGEAVASSATLIKCWDPGTGELMRCSDPEDTAKVVGLKHTLKKRSSIRTILLAATSLSSGEPLGTHATEVALAEITAQPASRASTALTNQNTSDATANLTLGERLRNLRGPRNAYYEGGEAPQSVAENFVDMRQLDTQTQKSSDPLTDAYAIIPETEQPQSFRDLGHAYTGPVEVPPGNKTLENGITLQNLPAIEIGTGANAADNAEGKNSPIKQDFGDAARSVLIGLVTSIASRAIIKTLSTKAFAAIGIKAFVGTGLLVGMPSILAVGLTIAATTVGASLTTAAVSGLARTVVYATRRGQIKEKGWFMREFAQGAKSGLMWGALGGIAGGVVANVPAVQSLFKHGYHVIKAVGGHISSNPISITRVLQSVSIPHSATQIVVNQLGNIDTISSTIPSAATDSLTSVGQTIANVTTDLHQGLTVDQFGSLSKHAQALANLKGTAGVLHFIKDASYELLRNKNPEMVNAGVNLMKKGLAEVGANAHSAVTEMLNRDLGIMSLLRDHNASAAIEYAKHAGKFGTKLLAQATKYAVARPA